MDNRGFGWNRPEDVFSRIRDDLKIVTMAENYNPNPQDILRTPSFTLKEYKCAKCQGDMFYLIAIPVLSPGLGRTTQFRCSRCRALVNSGSVRESLNARMGAR